MTTTERRVIMNREQSARWLRENAVVQVRQLTEAFSGLDVLPYLESLTGLAVSPDTWISHTLAEQVVAAGNDVH